MSVREHSSAAILCALTLLAPASAWATAFFVNQQSVKGLGRVDSGNTAAGDELGTIFFNPAALNTFWKEGGQGQDSAASFAVQLIIPRGSQDNRGSTAATPFTGGAALPYAGGNSKDPTDPSPVPNFYYARRLDDRTSIGIGMNVPFGLRAQFDPGWYGRYDATEASLRTVNVSLVGAYRVDDRWSIGIGLDGQYARTTLTSAIPNPLTPGGPTAQTDGTVHTHGDTRTGGFNAGLLYSITEENRIGLHYRSGMKHRIDGTSEFSGLTGPLAIFNGEVGARADLKLPAITTLGFRMRANDEWVFMGDVQWYDWSVFDEVRIRFADGRPDGVRTSNYKDAYGVALGAEHRARGSPLTLRGGLHYDTTPTVDAFRDTTVPDSERLWLGFGATYQVNGTFQLDFAFNHVFFRKTEVALTRTFFDGTPLASSAFISGAVKSVVNTLAIDMRWRF